MCQLATHRIDLKGIMRTLLVAAAAAALILSAAAGALGVAPADTVADSCHAISDFVDMDFCTSRLRSVPGAAAADRFGHLLMATDLAVASGAKAQDLAAAAARDDGSVVVDPGERDAMQACAFLYGAASVPGLRLLRQYAAARNWAPAHALVMLTMDAGDGCDAAVGGSNGRMAGPNHEFDQLSAMVTALLNSINLYDE